MGPRVREEDVPLDYETKDDKIKITINDPDWKPMEQIVWFNVTWYLFLHVGALYGLHLAWTQASWVTIIYTAVIGEFCLLGITGGSHRLWAHRSYKASLPFRLFLLFCNTACGQNSVYEWARDHRVHHKYSETDADPHNSNRGFFFSHMGWLMCRKHPLVTACGKKIDLSDLTADPLLNFQRRHYMKLFFLLGTLVPTLIPTLFWSENFWVSYWVCAVLRYVCQLHITWLVNSAAHMWGFRPYDSSIASAENMFVSSLALGEGHHNYHHTFPWDYSTSEWGWSFNLTTIVLDTARKLRLIYDCKSVPKETIAARCNRTGIKRD